jgi:hypothetical protein
MRSNSRDSYRDLTLADLRLVVRARRLDFPPDLDRDEIIIMLRELDEHPSVPPREPSASTREQSGWWTAMSVAELRSVARACGFEVAAGIRRRELVDLVIEHDIARPAGQTPGRRRFGR